MPTPKKIQIILVNKYLLGDDLTGLFLHWKSFLFPLKSSVITEEQINICKNGWNNYYEYLKPNDKKTYLWITPRKQQCKMIIWRETGVWSTTSHRKLINWVKMSGKTQRAIVRIPHSRCPDVIYWTPKIKSKVITQISKGRYTLTSPTHL